MEITSDQCSRIVDLSTVPFGIIMIYKCKKGDMDRQINLNVLRSIIHALSLALASPLTI